MKLAAEPLDFVIVQIDADGGNLTDSDTTCDLEAGDGSELPTIEAGEFIPAYVVACNDPEKAALSEFQAADLILISVVSTDTLTFSRTASARAITQGEYVFLSLGAYQWAMTQRKIADLETMLARMTDGGVDHVPQYGSTGAPSELLVEESAPQAMTVDVNPGIAWIDSEITRVREATTSSVVVAPVTNYRIDLVQLVKGVGGLYDSIDIKTGVESITPSVPTVDSGAIALASVLLHIGTTVIEDALITDQRVRR